MLRPRRTTVRGSTPLAVLVGLFAVAALLALPGVRLPEARVKSVQLPGRAQVPGRPVPGREAPAPEGKGRIRGAVVGADTNAPLREAVVRLAGRDGGHSGSTATDADGRFEFAGLPAGRYVVSASKPAYLTRQYGQRVEHVPGRPLELSEGQTIQRITIVLPRGGVAFGRILDQYGEVLPNARVHVLRYEARSGRRRLVRSGRVAQTDDLGQYRVWGLSPGDYYVGAAQADAEEGEPGPSRRDGHAPTYYPGTTNVADAQRISIGVSQEAVAEFPLVPARLVTVSGTVTTSSGKPAAGGRVVLNYRSDLATGIGLPSSVSGPIAPDGSFTVGPVAPGTYVIVATADTGRSFGSFRLTEEPELGTAPVTVGPDPLTGATVGTAPGGLVAGRIVSDSGELTLPTGSVRVGTTPADLDDPEADIRLVPSVAVAADRSFELRGLRGRYLLSVSGLPPRHELEAVYVGSKDVTDQGVTVGPFARLSGLRLVVTSRATEISGTVVDREAKPVRDYVVLAFPEDNERWTHPQLRYTRVARPDQDGRYAIGGLPPGSYWAIALEDLEPGASEDPESLTRLRDSATRVPLAKGEARVLNLTLQQD